MAEPVAIKRRIGFVAEDQIFPETSTAAELFALHKALYPNWDDTLMQDLLRRFRLLAHEKSGIASLSKGQAREVGLICAIAHRPELLILDEPAGGLDPSARRSLLEASIQALADHGSTILFSTHHMTDIERLGGRVVLLDEGRVRLDSGLQHLLHHTCIAVVPKSSAPDSASLIALAGCLGVRSSAGTWHAVFEGDPAAIRARLQAELRTERVECERAPLEELFVDLVGEADEPQRLDTRA